MDCSFPGSSVHANSPGKNTGVCSCSLLQGIFPSQGSNPGCIHCRQTLYHPSHQGSSVVSFLSVLILSVSLLCHLLDLSCAPTPCDPVDCSPPGSLSMGFSRQEYWSGLPCPFPRDLPDPGIKPCLFGHLHCRQTLYHLSHGK